MQPGDVKATYADTKSLENEINFKPNTSINVGIKKLLVGIFLIIKDHQIELLNKLNLHL